MRRPGYFLLIATAFAPAAAAQRTPAAPIPLATDAPIAPVTTAQRIMIDGKPLAYRATWSEMLLNDTAGKPQATISATSYVRDGVTDPARRPVIVLFNGGPGASSSPLHFNAFGPRRLTDRDAAGNRTLVDNAATLLDVADLVFVDPVGTGFSRPIVADGGKPYWSPAGDAASVLALVRDWLRINHRERSPLFVAGESYGGYRLGTMARDMADLNIAGLILLSPALDFGGAPDQHFIDQLPTLAVAAWHHGKTGRTDGAAADVWEDARRFAQGDYATALQQGSALPAADRARIAAKMAAMTGMPVNAIAASDLRLDSQRFLETLVPGSIVGRLDVRVAAPKPDKPLNPNRPAAANDPSLGLGRSNVITSVPMGDYLRAALKVPTTRDYYSLTLDVNFNWDWGVADPQPGQSWDVTGNIAALMTAKPAARLLLLGGYYDLATPLLGPRYSLTHSKVPLDRVAMVALPAGHSPFEGADNLARVSAVVHAFVSGWAVE